jgi:hypothetical protein
MKYSNLTEKIIKAAYTVHNVLGFGFIVGQYVADIIVEKKVILELKAVKDLAIIHEVQLVNYLKATSIEVGLLINFGHSVQIKRKVFDKI